MIIHVPAPFCTHSCPPSCTAPGGWDWQNVSLDSGIGQASEKLRLSFALAPLAGRRKSGPKTPLQRCKSGEKTPQHWQNVSPHPPSSRKAMGDLWEVRCWQCDIKPPHQPRHSKEASRRSSHCPLKKNGVAEGYYTLARKSGTKHVRRSLQSLIPPVFCP